jgi:SAM-dependent methyltransferase
MALKQHLDERVRFDQQVDNARQYVLPFVETTKPIGPGIAVMEIGCGEGGVLRAFSDKGAKCLGIDLDPPRIEFANEFLADEVAAGKAEFLLKNVYDADFLEKYRGTFDVLLLKDAIEHIPDQEKFIPYLKNFLKPGGQIFFGFPPWAMPFGGHQQICQTKLASKLPWYHLLPRPLYKSLLKAFGEGEGTIRELMEIKDTQISIERFERIVRKSGMKVLHKQHFLINPIYRYKFGLEPRKQFALISALPYLRDVVTTCVYYTIG